MRPIATAWLLCTLAIFAWSADGVAQASHYADRPLEINGHVGGLVLDNLFGGNTEFMAGVRAAWNLPSGLGFGANVDWSRTTTEAVDQGLETDLDVLLYSGEVAYTFPSASLTHFFVAGGVGAATVSPDEEERESETNLLLPLGAGVKWFNRTDAPGWGLRFDVRDNIIALDAGGVSVGDETTHNIEFSGGVSLFLGGPGG